MPDKLYYDHFTWEATIPFDCPLCGVHIPAGVKHECSNPKPDRDPRAVAKTPMRKRSHNAEQA